MHRKGRMPAFALLLLLGVVADVLPQEKNATEPRISVESSVGRTYQRNASGKWNTVYAGRVVAIGREIETSVDATLELAVGSVRLELLPLTVAEFTGTGGTGAAPRITIRLTAGAVTAKMAARGIQLLRLECPFGSVVTSDGDFTLDGNRVRVTRGAVEVRNADGRARRLEAGEELIIAARGPLARPVRYR